MREGTNRRGGNMNAGTVVSFVARRVGLAGHYLVEHLVAGGGETARAVAGP
jgi:hypothetical protein